MSICQREDNETNEGYQDDHKTPSRTKKNKTRIPQNVISDDDDDEDIPITKHISYTNDESELKNKKIIDNFEEENPEIKEKIKKAKKNWEYLIDKLIQKRIDILREMVKKEKAENESDEEEDEKIEDILKEASLNKKDRGIKSFNRKMNNNLFEKKFQDLEDEDEDKIEEEKEE